MSISSAIILGSSIIGIGIASSALLHPANKKTHPIVYNIASTGVFVAALYISSIVYKRLSASKTFLQI